MNKGATNLTNIKSKIIPLLN